MMRSRRETLLRKVKQAAPVKAASSATQHAVSNLFGSPVRAIGDSVGSFFLGSKMTAGNMAGKRVQFAGKKAISEAEYLKLTQQARQGHKVPGVNKTKGPDGNTIFTRDAYRPGGAVGLAMKHPFYTAAGGGVAYIGGKHLLNRRAQNQAQAQQSGGQPPPNKQFFQTPIKNEAWG
jgi:hypothetical protein